jgi:hypothetical protein
VDEYDCAALVANENIKSMKWPVTLTRRQKNFWKSIRLSSMIERILTKGWRQGITVEKMKDAAVMRE